MTRYKTYMLDMVNERVIPMLHDLNTFFLPEVNIKRVLPVNLQLNELPYWSVYPVPPGRAAHISRAGLGQGELVHVVGLRLYFARNTAGANAGADHLSWLSWVCLPTTLLYFLERPSMCIDDTQDAPRWLDSSKTSIELASEVGQLPDVPADILGIEFNLALTFNFALNIR